MQPIVSITGSFFLYSRKDLFTISYSFQVPKKRSNYGPYRSMMAVWSLMTASFLVPMSFRSSRMLRNTRRATL